MRRALLLVVVGGVFSCTFDIPDVVHDGGARPDGPDIGDATFDGIQFRDGAADSTTDGPVATVYSDMANAANWATFDISTVTGSANNQYYAGGTFDGRYVYLAPTSGSPASSVVLRFDTTSSDLRNKTAWTPFDTTALSTAAAGFNGAVYDGAQFLYLTPFTTAASVNSAADGYVVRYDSHLGFASAADWFGFNATTLNAGAQGFAGEAFDGRYIYFAPYFAGSSTASGLVARFDTQQGFSAPSAWTFFDAAANLDPLAAGFVGAVFDGRYVTFVPDITTVALQLDTKGTFTDKTSWSSFNVAAVKGQSTQSAFAGGVYDGRYVYFVPWYYFNATSDTFGSAVVRFDTQMGFGNAGAWTTFDVAVNVNPLARGFAGGAFDGRYVYLVPNGNTGTSQSTGAFLPDGLVVRYDTTQPFTTGTSWSTFDTRPAFGSSVTGFFGAVFDGRFLYLVPASGTTVARFDARTPPSMPQLPAFQGSFY